MRKDWHMKQQEANRRIAKRLQAIKIKMLSATEVKDSQDMESSDIEYLIGVVRNLNHIIHKYDPNL